jgi:hypothetical protein
VRDDLNVILAVSSEPREPDHRPALPLIELDYCSPIVLSIALTIEAITIIKLKVKLRFSKHVRRDIANKAGLIPKSMWCRLESALLISACEQVIVPSVSPSNVHPGGPLDSMGWTFLRSPDEEFK